MTILGDRLRLRREELGYTQDELAHLVEAQAQTISKYERGKQAPLPEMLMKLATHLKCSADYLIGRSPIPESSLEELDPSERELIAYLRRLTDKPTAKKAAIASLLGQGIEKNTLLRSRRKSKK